MPIFKLIICILTLIKKSLLERDQLIISLLKHELFTFINKQPLFMKLLAKNSTTINNMVEDNILLLFIFFENIEVI
jgi:phosphate starvation-inducible membrane PsiE